jgi:hypothetical protein
MEITLNVPEELANAIQPIENHLPKILELGIRTWKERDGASLSGFADVLEKLASLPSRGDPRFAPHPPRWKSGWKSLWKKAITVSGLLKRSGSGSSMSTWNISSGWRRRKPRCCFRSGDARWLRCTSPWLCVG